MRFAVRKKKGTSALVMSFVVVIIIGLLFWQMETNLKPTLLAIAEVKAIQIATQAINDVINNKVSRSIDPQTLVTVRLDHRGRVVLIQPNTMEFNKLTTEATIKIQDAIKEIDKEKIYIPIGQIFGSQLFASLGPNIRVTVMPVGSVHVKVVDKFEQAGINQTRHMVYLSAVVQMRIVVPLVSNSVEVRTQVPIAEYIIVGEVPNTYVQFPFQTANDLLGNNNS